MTEQPVTLTSTDPQPPPGTIVRDDLGCTWELSDEDDGGMWWRTDAEDDPESWTKVAGNYGPVTVLELGEAPGLSARSAMRAIPYLTASSRGRESAAPALAMIRSQLTVR